MTEKEKHSFVIASDHTDINNRIVSSIMEFLKHHDFRCEIYEAGHGPDDDFPILATGAIDKVCSGEFDRAILIGGTGSGMAMVANKFPGIFAAVVEDDKEIKEVTLRDNPNVLCIPGWNTDPGKAIHMVRVWINTKSSDKEKYLRRREEFKKIDLMNVRRFEEIQDNKEPGRSE